MTAFVEEVILFFFLRDARSLRAFPVMVLGVVLVVWDTLHATD